jgi:hypothetical protein
VGTSGSWSTGWKDLRKEVEEEMAWNARLEKMLKERAIISDDEKINSCHTSAGSS